MKIAPYTSIMLLISHDLTINLLLISSFIEVLIF